VTDRIVLDAGPLAMISHPRRNREIAERMAARLREGTEIGLSPEARGWGLEAGMSGQFRSYRDLEVWQKAMLVAKEIYSTTAGFPRGERFGLTDQMRRAAVSVPSNLAEGHARISTSEFQRFIAIAMGSVAELETQALLSTDLGLLEADASNVLLGHLDSVGKMLRALHRSLGKRRARVQG
jgi:four helix bundle protein